MAAGPAQLPPPSSPRATEAAGGAAQGDSAHGKASVGTSSIKDIVPPLAPEWQQNSLCGPGQSRRLVKALFSAGSGRLASDLAVADAARGGDRDSAFDAESARGSLTSASFRSAAHPAEERTSASADSLLPGAGGGRGGGGGGVSAQTARRMARAATLSRIPGPARELRARSSFVLLRHVNPAPSGGLADPLGHAAAGPTSAATSAASVGSSARSAGARSLREPSSQLTRLLETDLDGIDMSRSPPASTAASTDQLRLPGPL